MHVFVVFEERQLVFAQGLANITGKGLGLDWYGRLWITYVHENYGAGIDGFIRIVIGYEKKFR